ncbi:tetrahydromethanopterin S-methyltransferase subunit MtrB [Methanosphaera sp.]
MGNDTTIIIDDDLVLDVNSGIIGTKNNLSTTTTQIFPIDDVINEIDRLETSINNLESSLNPKTTSSLSESGREGVYEKAGLLTNIIIGVIFALIFIILLL